MHAVAIFQQHIKQFELQIDKPLVFSPTGSPKVPKHAPASLAWEVCLVEPCGGSGEMTHGAGFMAHSHGHNPLDLIHLPSHTPEFNRSVEARVAWCIEL